MLPASRLMGVAALVLLGAVAGALAGWYLRGQVQMAPPSADRAVLSRPASLPELVSAGRYAEVADGVHGRLPALTALLDGSAPAARLAAIDAFIAKYGASFDALMYKADAESACRTRVGVLLQVPLVPETDDQQQALQDALSSAVDDCARQLIAGKRFGQVDQLYEQVTLAMPELAVYFLELGEFRLRTGNFDGALAVLSQIENHGDLGARARALMRQAEAAQQVEAPQGEDLPLTAHGTQFVVQAVIDDGPAVPLLIDTGAAMTVIDAKLLARLGYTLDGRREYFATAGGVVDAPVVSLHRIRLGNASMNELAVGALPMRIPGKVQGLLGMNFLRHFDFRIDQRSQTLHLAPI